MEEKKKKKILKKGDMLLLSAALVLCGILALLFFFLRGKTGSEAVVHVGDSVYGSYPIDKDLDLTIQTENGENELVIKDHSVYIASADCKNQICVHHTPITKPGETIVCIPHDLWIEIKNK